MPARRPSRCTPEDRSEIVFADSSLHFHHGDIHVIADQRRGNPFLAAKPWDCAQARTWFCCTERFGRANLREPRTLPPKFAEAVAIANGRILAVGSDAEIQGYAGREHQGR